MDELQFVGKHATRFEPPDLLFQRPDGDMSVDECRKLMQFADAIPVPEKGFFVLIDAGKGGRQDPEMMKLPEVAKSAAIIRVMVYYNTKFYHRTLIGVFMRVARFFNHPGANMQSKVFATEDEARAWIKEERERDAV